MARGSLLNLWGIPDSRPSAPPEPPEFSSEVFDVSSPTTEPSDVSLASQEPPQPKPHPFFLPQRAQKSQSRKSSSEGTVTPPDSQTLPSRKPKSGSSAFFKSYVVKLPVAPEALAQLELEPQETVVPEVLTSLVVKLRASPESLGKLQLPKEPRVVHSFFAKRQPSRAPSNPIPASEKTKPLGHPPFPTEHVRGERDHSVVEPLRKRKHANPVSRCVWPSDLPQLKLSSETQPDRLTLSLEQVEQIANDLVSPSDALRKRVTTKSALDEGRFESQMWTEKYAPKSAEECLFSTASAKVIDWITLKTQQLQSAPPPKRRKTALDGFVVDDSFDDDSGQDSLPNILLLSGMSGMGKTAAVQAAASELDGFVLEVNSSSRRAGRDLASVIEGIGQSHSVHSRRNCIVLVEDVDVIFENESGSFWQQLEKLASTSRRPVVTTCEDIGRVKLAPEDYELIQFGKPDLVRATQLCLMIGLAEGYVLDRRQVADCVVACKGDIRRSITQLQFWCQMLSQRPSGVDWYPKQYEMDSADRILTKNLNIPTVLQKPLSPLTDLDSVGLDTDAASALDVYRSTVVDRVSPEETPTGYFPLSAHCEQVIVPIINDAQQNLRTVQLQQQSPVFAKSIRNVFIDSGFAPLDVLACDLAPYARIMALADRHRLEILEQHAECGSRMTRRAWQSAGLDGRQHFHGDHEDILKTSYWTMLKPLAVPGSGSGSGPDKLK